MHTEEDILAEDSPAVGSLAADILAAEGSLAADSPEEDNLAVDKHLLNIPPGDNLIIRSSKVKHGDDDHI